ncbi:hypothetical protein CerSpe_213100 [Prunus speciosa]
MTTQISHINFDNCNFKSKSVIRKPLLDSFKLSIEDFVENCDVVQEGCVWKWEFVHKEGCVKRTVPLFVLKEVVDDSRRKSEEDPFCIYCSYLGCNNNLVSKSKKITVRDEACKAFRHIKLIYDLRKTYEGAMETRLLFSVAFGSTWFGRWGYTFLRGSYGVSRDTYTSAIEFLGSLPLTEMRCGARGRKKTDLNKDLWTVYDEVLMRRKNHVQTILNCNVFCKEIPLRQMLVERLTVTFVVRDADDNELPGMVGCECTTLHINDVADLKGQVTRLIQDPYHALSNFTITEMEGEGTDELKENMWVKGDGADMDYNYVAEGGRGWLVTCTCGAKDDDGENMIECDTYREWKHIECLINDGFKLEDNAGFICSVCSAPRH